LTRYIIRHETLFSYETPMHFARCNVRLRPITWPGQVVEQCLLSAEPGGHFAAARSDPARVNTDRLVVDRPIETLRVISDTIVSVDRDVPFAELGDYDIVGLARLARDTVDNSGLAPVNYLFPTSMIPLDPTITSWCAESVVPGASAFEFALALAQRIWREFRYAPGETDVLTRPAQAFEKKAGVCQDFAQIMVAGLRGLGLPAAYASGYLRTVPPPGQPRLIGADATHAWAMLWCGPARGWVGFDPTNGIAMAGDHILIAIGRDYADVAPIDGIFTGSGAQQLAVAVDVAPQD
jgi:transglutaminase-like putative cysteine protease